MTEELAVNATPAPAPRPLLPPLPQWALDLAELNAADRAAGRNQEPLPIGPEPTPRRGGGHSSRRTVTAPRLATDAQIRFIADLVRKVDPNIGRTASEWVQGHIGAGTFTRDMASDAITRLKDHAAAWRVANPAPATPVAHAASGAPLRAVPDAATVPAGRYAIEVDGVVKFYRVDRPTEGTYAGRVFVKVQAGDDMHRLPWPVQVATLNAIAEVGAKEASIRYGRELGVCGRCGRTLTDEESRAAGIGPICANRF